MESTPTGSSRTGQRPIPLGFLYFAAADAGHADPDGPVRALDHGMHALQVGQPAALGEVMGMADPVPAHRLFAAHFTHLSHEVQCTMAAGSFAQARGLSGRWLTASAAISYQQSASQTEALVKSRSASLRSATRPRATSLGGTGAADGGGSRAYRVTRAPRRVSARRARVPGTSARATGIA